MAEVRLAVATRTEIGSGEAGRMRLTGRIPAVVYGGGEAGTAVSVDGRELRAALSGEKGLNAILDLEVDGTKYKALAREIQRHPTRGTVQHVDFQIVKMDQAITVDVPIELTGEAEKVLGSGGRVVQDMATITVNATPATIPNSIEIDVTNLELGGVIRLGEVKLPNGVTCDIDGETVVVTGLAPRKSGGGGATAEAEGDESEEGAEGGETAEGTEGDESAETPADEASE